LGVFVTACGILRKLAHARTRTAIIHCLQGQLRFRHAGMQATAPLPSRVLKCVTHSLFGDDMELVVKSVSAETLKTATLVVAVGEGRTLSDTASTLDTLSGGAISAVLKRGDLSGKIGQSLLLHSLPNLKAERVLLVGSGKERNNDPFRKIIAAPSTLKLGGACRLYGSTKRQESRRYGKNCLLVETLADGEYVRSPGSQVDPRGLKKSPC
jgi:leucyl aminopeptidase